MDIKSDGIILVDKPLNWSSFDVVAKVRGILKNQYFKATGLKKKVKVGHTGTLDPSATGLMILVVGSYCKRASEFSKLDKTYEVSMRLGAGSTTGDAEGDITAGPNVDVTEDELKEVLDSFLGESYQVPPAYSAIKINGQRAYNLARKGQEVKIEPRQINIYDIKLTSYSYPDVNFVVSVSSGTYIRSLAEDIASSLGTLGYLTALRRTVVGQYQLADAKNIDHINSSDLITIDK